MEEITKKGKHLNLVNEVDKSDFGRIIDGSKDQSNPLNYMILCNLLSSTECKNSNSEVNEHKVLIDFFGKEGNYRLFVLSKLLVETISSLDAYVK